MSPLPSARAKGRRAPMADINVTPLVDVMLVLLIIFMVTAPMMNSGVPVKLPDSQAKPLDQAQDKVELSLDARGRLFIDDQEVPAGALDARLAEIVSRKVGEGPQMIVRADRGLDYGRVMQVMGALNGAGLNRIALVSVPAGR